jgi:hypothetical protein
VRRFDPLRFCALLTGVLTGLLVVPLVVPLVGCVGHIEDTDQTAGRAEPGTGGVLDDGQAPGPGPSQAAARCTQDEAAQVGPSVMRRLSKLELRLTLQDLFQLPSSPALESVPPDNDKDGFQTFAEVQAISPQHLRTYLDETRALADALLADPARRTAVLGCEPSSATCLRAFVERFGRLAYRRTLAADELTALVERATTNALDETDRFRYAIQSLLVAPDFLYRVEVGDAPEALSQLTAEELATRLSFGLWGRAPDLQLLDRAARGELESTDGLQAVVASMLEDPRADIFYASFFRQWLGYGILRAPVVPPAGWSAELMPQLQTESDELLSRYAFGSDAFLDVLTTNETSLSPELATFYDLPTPQADGSVTIPATHARANAGVLGHAALLSLKSDGDAVALRGNWLRETFFCKSLHIPPEVADQLDDLLVGLSPVQIVEKRNTEAACKGCHAMIDPIGVGLSRFDATGRWDNAVDITVYGIEPRVPDLTDGAFDSLAELASKLRASPQVGACLSEKVFLHMSGRDASTQDRCAVESAHEAFSETGDFRSLLTGLVSSPAFRLRRPTEASEASAVGGE